MQLARTLARRSLRAGRVSSFYTPRLLSSQGVIIPQRLFNTSAIRFAEQKDTEQSKEESTSGEETAAEAAEENEEVTKLKKQIDELEAKVVTAETEVKEMKDRMLRNLAEMENVRTRAKKDVDSAKAFALQGFAKKLLDSTDNIQWALAAAKEAAEKGDNEDLKSLYDGVILTESSLLKTLESQGIVRFQSLGEKFDPNLHDGLFQFQDPTKEPGTVGQVMKEGWKYNDRIIRPANVGTVQAPPS